MKINTYNGFRISYENGQFVATKGKDRFESMKEADLKNKIDTHVRTADKALQKPTKIGKYKGFKILYRNDTFTAEKNDVSVFSESSEQSLKSVIDNHLSREKAEQEAREKISESKAKIKKLERIKVVFDAKEFNNTIKGVESLTSEGRMKFDKGLMTIIEMDPANVAMTKRVAKYDGKLDDFLIGLNFNNLWQVLKKVMNKKMFKVEKIILSFKMIEEHMIIQISNGFGEFSLPTQDLEGKETKMPELKHPCHFKMKRTEFNKYIQMADLVAESVLFEVNNGQFCVTASGDLSGYKKEGIIPVKTTHQGIIRSKFSIEYLKKDYVSGEDLTIRLGTDYPLVIEDELGNWFCLAPRVEND